MANELSQSQLSCLSALDALLDNVSVEQSAASGAPALELNHRLFLDATQLGNLSSAVSSLHHHHHQHREPDHPHPHPLQTAAAAAVATAAQHHARLAAHAAQLQQTAAALDEAVALVAHLQASHQSVAVRTAEIRGACAHLLDAQRALLARADETRARLVHLDEADRVAAHVGALQLNASSAAAVSNGATALPTASASAAGASTAAPATSSLLADIPIPMPSIPPEEFVALLRRVDEFLALFASFVEFKDLARYQATFRQLHTRLTAAVQHHVTAALQAASSRVTATHSLKHVGTAAAAAATNAAATEGATSGNGAGREGVATGDGSGSGSGSAAAIATAASLIEFRAVASQLRPLLAAVRAWGAAGSACVSAAEYRQLLTDCLTQYYNHRYRVLCAEIEAHVRRLPPTLAFVDLIRSACTFVIGLGTLEQRLFTEFFPTAAAAAAVAGTAAHGHPEQGDSDAAVAETLTDLLENVGHTVHALLRPTIIRLADVDSLSEVAAVLRFEVLEDQLSAAKAKANASGSISALVHTPLTFVVHRMLQDVQERLVYRAQMYVRDEVSNYKLTAADTELIVARAAGLEGAGAAATSASAPTPDAASAAAAEPKQSQPQSQPQPQQQWFTTLSRTLTLLAKLHRCLDAGVFRRLAQDALSACTASLLRATLWIRSAQGTARAATMGAIDADLFLIKHLLVLRERIAPFDIVDAKITQKTLDFTRMREKIAAVLTRRASLLSFLHDEAGAERPLVAEHAVDTARDVERELKAACELLIRRETGALVGGMLSFLAKLAAPGAGAALFGAAGADDQQQQHAAVMCEAIVTETARAFPAGPRALAAKLAAYLGNPVTEKVLLKPLRSNVHDTFERMRAVLTQYCATDAAVRLAAALPDFDAHSL